MRREQRRRISAMATTMLAKTRFEGLSLFQNLSMTVLRKCSTRWKTGRSWYNISMAWTFKIPDNLYDNLKTTLPWGTVSRI
jgi:hypothetical protein